MHSPALQLVFPGFIQLQLIPVVPGGCAGIGNTEEDFNMLLLLCIPADPGDEALDPAILGFHHSGFQLK